MVTSHLCSQRKYNKLLIKRALRMEQFPRKILTEFQLCNVHMHANEITSIPMSDIKLNKEIDQF